MKYRFEIFPNPECMAIHVSFRLIDSTYVSDTVDGKTDKERMLHSLLKGVEGVTEVNIRLYEFTVHRAATFEREEILKESLERVTIWAKQEGLMGPDEEVVQLPTIRTDIRVKMCPECQAIHDAEMKELARDMNSLDW